MYFRDFHPVPVSANLGEHEQCSGDRSGCDTIHILNVLRQLGVKSFFNACDSLVILFKLLQDLILESRNCAMFLKSRNSA